MGFGFIVLDSLELSDFGVRALWDRGIEGSKFRDLVSNLLMPSFS